MISYQVTNTYNPTNTKEKVIFHSTDCECFYFLQNSFLSMTMGEAGESGREGLWDLSSSGLRPDSGKWKGRGDCGKWERREEE